MHIKPPSDPVIKKRVYLTNNASPLKRTMINGIIIVGFIGIIVYYFYPNLFKTVDNSKPLQTAESELTGTSEMVSPFALTEKKTPSTFLETSPNVTRSSTIQPTDPINSVLGQPQSVKNPPQVTAIQRIAPAQPEVNQETSIKPIVSPPPISSSTVVAESTQVSTETDSKATTHNSVESLLAKAQEQIKRTRFTSPKGDNAFQTYQELAQQDVQAAQPILDKIVTWYFKRGKKYLDKGRLTKPTKRGNAYKMYQKLYNIAPKHPKTQTLFNEITNILTARAEKQLQKNRLTKPKKDNAYATYQEMQRVMPNSPKTHNLLATMLQQLLNRADQQMEKEWYTTPKNDNAVSTYRQLLTIAPGNTTAQEGLQKIAHKYYQLAARKNRQARYEDSMKWIEKGLQVNPADPDLRALKQEVTKKLR